jgi:protein-disulfide isomerase
VWLWGAAYYAALGIAILFARPAVFWLVMIGLGTEISFAWIMVSMKLICIFCLLNAVVVVLLVVPMLGKNRIWQAMAISLLVFVISNLLLSSGYPTEASGWPENQGDSVVAKVGDETITIDELESPLATRVYQLQREIYRMKREHLEELIDGILLRKEAEQKGITVRELVNSILPKGIKVSEEEVDNYYRQNQSQWVNWPGTQEELRNRIRIYLQGQKARQEIRDNVNPLRERYPVTVFLKEPPLPFSKVSVGDSPVLGPPNAAVTVVEFSDYLCPACRRNHDTAKKIREMYAGKIRWVFKDYPLEQHKGAKKLAEAGHCIEEQSKDKFWDFQDLLFASSEKPDLKELKAYTQKLGLDVDRFTQCFESGKYSAKVEQEIKAARESGVRVTPTFIINGRLKPGILPFENFKQIIDQDLKKARLAHSGE